MKRAVIVHCWGGNPNYCWYPQTKKELENAGFKVLVPEMPETDEPKLSLWLPKLREVIGEPDEELVLIGHSAGSVTILRFLESLPKNQKIGKVVLVAGFTDALGYKELKNFFPEPFDFSKIKPHADQFVFIHSDNDPFVNVSHGELLKEKLGGKLIVKHGMGHFSGPVDGEDSCTSLSEVFESIII
jgi:predicted alpha/beta hydrolase family esterase